jgi:hypothetical protein
MNTNSDERQHEIEKYRAIARRLFSEAKWIKREFYNLPFLKRQTALKALLILKTEARAALRKASSLETEN